MSEHRGQPRNNEELDLRPENPYTKSYFEFTHQLGDKLVNNFQNHGLNPDQINSVLADLTILAGMTGGVGADTSGNVAKGENWKAIEQGTDWMNAIVAGAQQSLAEKTGVTPVNDMRKSIYGTQNKYRPPTR